MEMESEELLYDDQNTEEEVEHDLAGVDVDGLLGDDDQSMAGQSDVDPAHPEEGGEEVFDTNCDEAAEYAEEEECQGEEEFTEENTEENAEEIAEESMDQEQEQEQSKEPATEVSVGSHSNVCCLVYFLIKYKLNSPRSHLRQSFHSFIYHTFSEF